MLLAASSCHMEPALASGRWRPLGTLILGSKSWSRSALLGKIEGLPRFSTAVADIDESAIRSDDPSTLVHLLGHAKADALLASGKLSTLISDRPGKNLLVTGDSVVAHKGQILEKPESKDQARSFLRSYRTAPATTVSSIVIVDIDTGRRWDGIAEGEVYFMPMPDDVIEDLVENGGAMESAGGLRVEHPTVERFTDCIMGEKSAVMGFSIPLAESLLLRAVAAESK